MCGILALWQQSANIDQIKTLLRQTMIRGKHATGVTFLKNGKLSTVKEGIPAEQFISEFDFGQVVDSDNQVLMIAHIRYSTSDLRFNQPFQSGSVSIAHNGVISQEDCSTWKYPCETENDSELVLRSIEKGLHPLTDFPDSSQAVVGIRESGAIFAWRNQARPLWVSQSPNQVVFTSTLDIAKRSGLTNTEKCDMMSEYSFCSRTKTFSKRDIAYDHCIQDLQ